MPAKPRKALMPTPGGPRLLPLGGAREIGASCVIYDVAGVRICFDAGVRTGHVAPGQPTRPAFERLSADELPHAVIVTHAHVDHTGALPMASDLWPGIPLHATMMTSHLIEVLHRDAIRLMANDEIERREGDVPAYTERQVEHLLSRLVEHPYYQPFYPVPGRTDIRATFFPAGHIAGAALTYLETPAGTIMHLGDYSKVSLPSCGGVDMERLPEADIVVSEGTYGSQVLPDRTFEETRLVESLERVASRGGNTLIPAFAVGRAQDLVMIIVAAKQRGHLKDVNVYLDGMVKTVCGLYQQDLHQQYGNRDQAILFSAELGIFKANTQSRARLLAGDVSPCVVIASSGMLLGGVSPLYAEAFGALKKNAIFFSGYQDSESPGAAMLRLKRGKLVQLNEKRVRIRCEVGQYRLSAHADQDQIAEVVGAIKPQYIYLWHGSPSVLTTLAERLGPEKTHLLENGIWSEPLLARTRVKRAGKQLAAASAPDVGAGVEWGGETTLPVGARPTREAVVHLWEQLVQEGTDRTYSENQIVQRLCGAGFSAEQRSYTRRLLSMHRLYFLSGTTGDFKHYRPRPMQDVLEMRHTEEMAATAPLSAGDVVLCSDWGGEYILAAVAAVDLHSLTVIPAEGQKSAPKVPRGWVRVVLGFSVKPMLHDRDLIARWLHDLLKLGRDEVAPLNAADVWFASQKESSVTLLHALVRFFGHLQSAPQPELRVSAGLALLGSNHYFQLGKGGHWIPRSVAEVCARTEAFLSTYYVRSQPKGTVLRLQDGEEVVATGKFLDSTFEAERVGGGFTRKAFRKVVVPETFRTSVLGGEGGAAEASLRLVS